MRNPDQFQPIYSIGHSHHSPDYFLKVLRHHQIDVVWDVRSSPFSRRAPQFNRAEMSRWLRDAGLHYAFGGDDLGGRPADARMYVAGRANYELMAVTDGFRTGLRRVARAAKSWRVALMCAEAEPLDCHRFLLIGRAASQAMQVYHILPSGIAEPHRATEQRLLSAVGFEQCVFFDSQMDALANAYALRASRIAFLRSAEDSYADSSFEANH